MGTFLRRTNGSWFLVLPVFISSGALAFQLEDPSGPSPDSRAAMTSHLKRAAILEPRDMPHADMRVDVPLVLIPVHVTTPLGASVTTLKQENFRLFEDNVEQRISQFASEDAPISIGLLLDTSGSMRNKIQKSAEAAAAFFRTANAED